MISFHVNGDLEKTMKFLSGLKMVRMAFSLGDVQSLIEHPASMTHQNVPKEKREKVGITDNLCRLSCGCEDAEDIMEDLGQALAAMDTTTPEERKLNEIFDKYDTNKNGFLEKDEALAFMKDYIPATTGKNVGISKA